MAMHRARRFVGGIKAAGHQSSAVANVFSSLTSQEIITPKAQFLHILQKVRAPSKFVRLIKQEDSAVYSSLKMHSVQVLAGIILAHPLLLLPPPSIICLFDFKFIIPPIFHAPFPLPPSLISSYLPVCSLHHSRLSAGDLWETESFGDVC